MSYDPIRERSKKGRFDESGIYNPSSVATEFEKRLMDVEEESKKSVKEHSPEITAVIKDNIERDFLNNPNANWNMGLNNLRFLNRRISGADGMVLSPKQKKRLKVLRERVSDKMKELDV